MFKNKSFHSRRSRRLLIAKMIITASVLTTSVFGSVVAGHAKAQSQDTPRVLKNDDVVSLVKAGLSDSAIIALFARSQTNFDVFPQALIKLKDAGVSNAVIEPMVTPRTATSAPAPTPRDSEAVSNRRVRDCA